MKVTEILVKKTDIRKEILGET